MFLIILIQILYAKLLLNTLPQTVSQRDVEFGLKIVECSFWEGFCKDISNWISGGDMFGNKETKHNSLADKVVIQLNMFTASMKTRLAVIWKALTLPQRRTGG